MNTARPGLPEFRTAVLSNDALQAEFRESDPRSEADVVAFAAERGYSFSVDDLNDSVELVQDQLDQVVGGAGYLKYDGVDGESRDAQHKDWINLLSVSSSITRPM